MVRIYNNQKGAGIGSSGEENGEIDWDYIGEW